jgi:hypothetical protein
MASLSGLSGLKIYLLPWFHFEFLGVNFISMDAILLEGISRLSRVFLIELLILNTWSFLITSFISGNGPVGSGSLAIERDSHNIVGVRSMRAIVLCSRSMV